MDIILWLHYTVVRLIVVLGVVFIDYLFYLSIEESAFFKMKPTLRKITWLGILFFSLVILQGAPVLSDDLSQNRYTTLIQNMDLQLIVLYYFLHMIKGTMMLHFNVFVSVIITFYYIYQGDYQTIQDYVVGIINVLLIYTCCRLVLKLKDKNLNNIGIYFLLTLVYGVLWGGKLYPAMDFRPSGYFLFLLNFVMLMIMVRTINKMVRKQLVKFDNLSLEARTDFLTGIGNRLSFDREFSQRFALSHAKENLVFAMIDIDYFKKINDDYGHDIGDIIIKNVAKIISQTLFQYQLESQVFRIGGEEFGILFQEKSRQDITEILETISKRVGNFYLNLQGEKVGVTVSAGVSRCRKTDTDKEDLYKRADKYLYIAKREGRNAIFMEGKIKHIS